MAVTTDTLIVNVLTDINQDAGGADQFAKADILRYLDEAQRSFNNLTHLVKASFSLPDVADQIEYDLPSDFKGPVLKAEYDALALVKVSENILDSLDREWRDATHRATLTLTPLYYLTHLLEEGKIVFWPPPNTTATNNFTGDYVQETAALTLGGDIEPQLEKYQKALEDYCKHKVYLRPNIQARELAAYFKQEFLNEALIVNDKLFKRKPKLPLGIKPVFNRAGLSSKELFIST
jgi:hypothetical protein